jgi:TorA maturation chaperone TorD
MPESMELARARHRLYGLLGRLLADGLSDELRPVIEALPALSPLLEVDAEALAVEHTRWFAFELSPHESAFLDGALNSAATAQVRATWTACGFASQRTDLEPDHIAMHVGALSFLCATELEARQDGVDPAPVLVLQHRVTTHLIAWLPLLTSAVDGPWRSVLELLEEMVVDHHGAAPEPLLALPIEKLNPDVFLTPDRCGWVCTWVRLRAASERSGCALGFGSKRRAIRALLDDEAGREALVNALSTEIPPQWAARRTSCAARLASASAPQP